MTLGKKETMQELTQRDQKTSTRKSVGVITFFNYCNFGAALQCYGLYKTLSDLGYQVEYLDYTCPFIGHPFSIDSLRKRGLIGYIYQGCGTLFYLPRRAQFAKFRERIAHTEPLTPSNIDVYGDSYDAYITGSDQVWSTKLTDFDTNYFLSFVRDHTKKRSYAASFGGQSYNMDRADEYRLLLSDFAAISVREDYGRQIVHELTGGDADITIDPTLLLRREDWEQVASSIRYDSKPYIMVYQLGFSNNLVKAANRLRKQKGVHVRYVPFPLGGFVPGRYQLHLGPAEWLAQFRDASYVVTDSYHGVIFSLLFEKQFVVVAAGQHKNQRVVSLLEHLGLENRVIENDVEGIDEPIDYDRVKALLELDRQTSIEWLTKHL